MRYEWFLKRMQAECPEQVGRFIGQVGKETGRVLARLAVPKELRRWKGERPDEWMSGPVRNGREASRPRGVMGWMMVGLVGVLLVWLFRGGSIEEWSGGEASKAAPVAKETANIPRVTEPEPALVEDSAVTRRLNQEEEETAELGGGPGAGDEPPQGGGMDGDEPSGVTALSANAEPARVGGEVREATRTVYVEPVYPEIAKRAGVTGVVILEAVIDPQGNVTDVNVLRSIPLLDQAAMDAVRQWKYRPTLLNGVPVPIVMTVTVNFGRT